MLQRDLPERLAQAHGAAKVNTLALSPAQAKWARFAQYATPMAQDNGIPSVDDLRVTPFIQSRWNQSTIWNGSAYVACYNYYTPPYASGASSNYVCGCNNTAWAQIMRYYNYPTIGVGTNTFNIFVDGVATNRLLRGGDGLGGPYAWNLMTLVPGASTTELQRQAIGALTADIGVAAGTGYASDGSGALLSGQTLRSVFFYSNAIYGSGLGDQFANQVHPNLDAKFPVCFWITDSSGDIGHVIVCDGYGYNVGTLYHHLNMGWGGYYDAWYNLPTVDAGGMISRSLRVFTTISTLTALAKSSVAASWTQLAYLWLMLLSQLRSLVVGATVQLPIQRNLRFDSASISLTISGHGDQNGLRFDERQLFNRRFL